jgi:metallophosphoesterase (TIGR00282 family)
MRILFIGDIVGRSGRTIVTERLPDLVGKWKLDLVAINGENAAGGFGITEVIYNELIDAGADAITLGNHAWDQREALVFIERAPRLIRPLNYPKGTPGRGAALVDTKNGKRALVINAMGRIFMDPLDDPFAAIERELSACALKSGADAIIIDFHCEATSEKQAMGWYLDGRVSAVCGTHTHVATADERLLPKGTHEYAKFLRPSELAAWCRAASLEPMSTRGLEYNPLSRRYRLSTDTSVNYLVACRKPA